MPLIDSLISEGWLKTPQITEAFRKIKREDFLLPEMKDMAELDGAFPIGHSQTISQPLTVAFMMEKLQPEAGDKILDVGSGSGWTSALLAEIVGRKGKIIAMEIIPGLVEFGKKNVAKYSFIEKGIAEFICGDGSKGYEKSAPYDKILVSASAEKLPEALKEQLKTGGRIVIPIKESIWIFQKTGKNSFKEEEYPGFVFVPLV